MNNETTSKATPPDKHLEKMRMRFAALDKKHRKQLLRVAKQVESCEIKQKRQFKRDELLQLKMSRKSFVSRLLCGFSGFLLFLLGYALVSGDGGFEIILGWVSIVAAVILCAYALLPRKNTVAEQLKDCVLDTGGDSVAEVAVEGSFEILGEILSTGVSSFIDGIDIF